MSLFLPGVSGNYASCPDSSGVSVTGDLDLRIYLAATKWVPATTMGLVDKWAATNQHTWLFRLRTDGKLEFFRSSDGSAQVTAVSSVATGLTNGTASWLRVTYATASGSTIFYTSTDGVTWTQLGTSIGTSAGTFFDSTSIIEVGSHDTGINSGLAGSIFYAEVRNGINGTIVANPDFRGNVSSGFSDSVGNVWAINAPNTTNLGNQAYLYKRTPTNYYFSPNVQGNVITTPNAVGLQITGDLDIRCLVAQDFWNTPNANNEIINKRNGNAAEFALRNINASPQLYWFESSVAVTVNATASLASVGIQPQQPIWLRVTRSNTGGPAGVYQIIYYYSYDGITWVQLGSTVNGLAAANPTVSNNIVRIGNVASSGQIFTGKIYYCELRSGINGTIVASPDFRGNVVSGFSDAQGNVWTLTTSGSPAAQLVTRSVVV